MESTDAEIVVGARHFAYKGFDMDICPFKACGHPMRDGMSLSSVLKYSDFGVPDELAFNAKELHYSPEPYWCSDATWIDQR